VTPLPLLAALPDQSSTSAEFPSFFPLFTPTTQQQQHHRLSISTTRRRREASHKAIPAKTDSTSLPTMAYDETDQLTINTIRVLAADATAKSNSGHPGAPM
jgi:hypothetical protein